MELGQWIYDLFSDWGVAVMLVAFFCWKEVRNEDSDREERKAFTVAMQNMTGIMEKVLEKLS